MARYLLTGFRGFLGKTVAAYLRGDIFSLGRDMCNAISCDLSIAVPDLPNVDVVIHAAGKAHIVPRTNEEIEEFYRINEQGTKNLAAALEKSGLPMQFIFISTVAVYGREVGEGITENTPLEGQTPYAKSKIAAESFLLDWCEQNGVNLVILRLPLIVGRNAPGNLGAMVKGIRSGKYFRIGSGEARKSMVLAEDVAAFIAGLDINATGIYNLTDGFHPTFKELEEGIAKAMNKRKLPVLPLRIAKAAAAVGDILGKPFPINSNTLKKITSTLTFNDAKARRKLNWNPRRVTDYLGDIC